MLHGRRVVLCVTGGVAAYKAAYLARRLVEAGADVKVAMSQSAREFIGAQTFASITGHHPVLSLFSDESVSPHTELARWADLLIVAPATASTIAKVANGISDGLISATILACRSPVLVAPAMHTEMWESPSTERNIGTLIADGRHLVGPEEGELAGGDVGIGRMAEPEDIVDAATTILGGTGRGRKLLITAGGTREPIDPVRYVGNRSSGKMGHALADEAAVQGYEVTLITTSTLPAHPSVKVVSVETAQQMLEAVSGSSPDVAIMAAAVADFRPAHQHDQKLARGEGTPSVEMEPTPDILASVMERESRPYVVGFAAETGGLDRARDKAAHKRVDLMVYNDVTEPGSGFGTDTNRVTIISKDGTIEELPLITKREVAARLLERIAADIDRQV